MWRKRDKGEGISIRSLYSKSLLSELGLPPYHQQKTGLFRNTMIAPATDEHAAGQTLKPVSSEPARSAVPPAMGTGPSSSLRLRFAPDKWSVPMAPVSSATAGRQRG